MTKKEILELLDILEDDDDVFILVGEKVFPICHVDSDIQEIIVDGDMPRVAAILAPCNCTETTTDAEIDLDFNLN